MTQLYASTSNTKKAKSSKFDFLLDFEKAAEFQRLFLLNGGRSALANQKIGFEKSMFRVRCNIVIYLEGPPYLHLP